LSFARHPAFAVAIVLTGDFSEKRENNRIIFCFIEVAAFIVARVIARKNEHSQRSEVGALWAVDGSGSLPNSRYSCPSEEK
jgi:hypothetical protein